MPESLTAKTVHGLKWNYLSTVVNFVLEIGVTAVLARIIVPGAFGLVAMAGVFISFGNYSAQLGVGQAMIPVNASQFNPGSADISFSRRASADKVSSPAQ